MLGRYGPDLRLILVDTQPTGVLVVPGVDRTNTTLSDKYDEIIDTYVVPDPQQVPEAVLERSCALPPEEVLSAGFWSTLLAARASDEAFGSDQLRTSMHDTLGVAASGALRGLEAMAAWQSEPAGVPSGATPPAAGRLSHRITRAAAANPWVRRWVGRSSPAPVRWRRAVRSRVR